MFETLLFEITDGRALITLNRPDVYNAFNDQMRKELLAALKEAEKNTAVRVVILTGAGKAFCSGQDLKEVLANPDRSISESLHKGYNPLIKQMRNMPKPVIGRLNGIAATTTNTNYFYIGTNTRCFFKFEHYSPSSYYSALAKKSLIRRPKSEAVSEAEKLPSRSIISTRSFS